MKDRISYTIAVTGLNATDNPGAGVPVIRSLKESSLFNCRIIGLSYELLEPGIYMHDIIDKTYQVPYPSAGTDALFSRLAYIHEKEKIDVIIPNFDAELYSYIKLEQKLQSVGIRVFVPLIEQFEARQKYNLFRFGEKNRIKVPESINCSSPEDFEQDKNHFEYPVVVKGKFYEAYVAKNQEQLYSFFGKVAAKWGFPVIVQRFVEGVEMNVIGLGDGKGNLIAAVPMRKQYITDKGKAWAGITIKENRLLQMASDFVRKTNWKGGFELELIKGKDDLFYLVEINPRIPAWVYLATGAGQNIPEKLILLALGRQVSPYEDYTVGKMFIRYSWDLIVDQEEFARMSVQGEN